MEEAFEYRLKPNKTHYVQRSIVEKDDTGQPVSVGPLVKMKAGDTMAMTKTRFKNANLKDRFEFVGPVADSSLVEEAVAPTGRLGKRSRRG